jgi:hypothetical protein
MPKTASEKPDDNRDAARKIDDMIANLVDWRGTMLADIRRWIHEENPEVVEEWKWRGAPVWSHEGMYANAGAYKGKVKLTFHHGAQLKDAGKLFNNGLGGNKWRAIDIVEGAALDETKFKALLREAIDYNTAHKVPKSKGSRA